MERSSHSNNSTIVWSPPDQRDNLPARWLGGAATCLLCHPPATCRLCESALLVFYFNRDGSISQLSRCIGDIDIIIGIVSYRRFNIVSVRKPCMLLSEMSSNCYKFESKRSFHKQCYRPCLFSQKIWIPKNISHFFSASANMSSMVSCPLH